MSWTNMWCHGSTSLNYWENSWFSTQRCSSHKHTYELEQKLLFRNMVYPRGNENHHVQRHEKPWWLQWLQKIHHHSTGHPNKRICSGCSLRWKLAVTTSYLYNPSMRIHKDSRLSDMVTWKRKRFREGLTATNPHRSNSSPHRHIDNKLTATINYGRPFGAFRFYNIISHFYKNS